MAVNDTAILAESMHAGMTDIPIEFIDEVFRRAAINYQDMEIPFGLAQLRAAWEEIKAEMRSEVSKVETEMLVEEMRVMGDCAHDYVFEKREPGDPSSIAGFDVCGLCNHAKPVFDESQVSAPAKGYLMAVMHAPMSK